jgi:hypothetical protein
MITEIDLQKAQANVEYWQDVEAAAYANWANANWAQTLDGSRKRQYEAAKRSLSEAQKEYDRIWAILKDQDVNDLSNEFYSDQIEKSDSSSSSTTTIFVVVAVVVLGGLYFILKK